MTTFSLEHAHPTQVISHSAPQPSSLWDTTGIEHPLPKASLASGQKEKRPREAHTDPDILPLGNDTCNFHSQFMGWSESCSQGWQQQGGRKKAPSQERQAGGATQEGAVKLVWDIATHCMLQEWIWDLFFFLIVIYLAASGLTCSVRRPCWISVIFCFGARTLCLCLGSRAGGLSGCSGQA